MKTNFKVKNTDEMEFEMTITMPLKDWRLIKDQLKDNYPSWQLGNEIRSMIAKAGEHFRPEKNDT